MLQLAQYHIHTYVHTNIYIHMYIYKAQNIIQQLTPLNSLAISHALRLSLLDKLHAISFFHGIRQNASRSVSLLL